MKNFKILCRAGEILKFYPSFVHAAYIRPRIPLASALYAAQLLGAPFAHVAAARALRFCALVATP